MGWLLSVYIGATVFGVGITLVDLFGLLGEHTGAHDGGHEAAGGHEAEAAAGHDVAHFDAHEGGGMSHDAVIDGHHDGGESPDQGAHAEHGGSVAGHDRPRAERSFLLGLLTFLRNLIYFCLGFGPVGWFALATSNSLTTSFLWSVPVGAAALVGTRALRRFMRRELNSEISTDELLFERGVVTVSIAAGEMGKVRVKLGEVYVERYARAASPEATIRVGTPIRVTEVGDDCVYVEVEVAE